MRLMKAAAGLVTGALLVVAGPVANGVAAPGDVSAMRAYDQYTINSPVTGTGARSGRTWGSITISRQSVGYKVVVKGNTEMRGRVTSEPGRPGPYFWAIAMAEYDYWDGHRWYHREDHKLGDDWPEPPTQRSKATPYAKTFNNVQNFYVYVCLYNPEHAMPQGCGARG